MTQTPTQSPLDAKGLEAACEAWEHEENLQEALEAAIRAYNVPAYAPFKNYDDVKESLGSQIDRLASFIMAEVPGEPSQSEGAVDTAIRWMRSTLTGTATPGGEK